MPAFTLIMADNKHKQRLMSVPADTCGLLAGNLRFINSNQYRAERKGLRGHEPCSVIISCSDSRVPPEVIFQELALGRIFVVRNAGAVLDNLAMESVKYAIEHLNVQNVIVIGHSSCGAVDGIWNSLAQVALPAVQDGKHMSVGSESTAGQHACQQLPTICALIRPSIKQDHSRTRGQNIVDSIQANALRQAELIKDKFGLDAHAAYYSLDTGKVQWLCHDTPINQAMSISRPHHEEYSVKWIIILALIILLLIVIARSRVIRG